MSLNSPLFLAVLYGSLQNLQHCLIQLSCDSLLLDQFGRSALMWACVIGHEDHVAILLPVSDPLVKDNEGCSALMLAARNGHEECVRLLLPRSNPLDQDVYGFSASEIALEHGHVAVAEVIDAHVLALKEKELLSEHVLIAPTRGKTMQRI